MKLQTDHNCLQGFACGKSMASRPKCRSAIRFEFCDAGNLTLFSEAAKLLCKEVSSGNRSVVTSFY